MDVSATLDNLGAMTLFVEDLQSSKMFYQDIFGLQVIHEDEDSAAFDFGNTILNLFTLPVARELVRPVAIASHEAGPRLQLTIWVDDADAACEDLRSRGVSLLNGLVNRPWGQRTATFADPAGNIWEVAQDLPKAGRP